MDLRSSVDERLLDQEPEERLRLLRLAHGEDAFELVSDGCEVGRRWPVPGLVRRRGDTD